jgi:hypothetical protein
MAMVAMLPSAAAIHGTNVALERAHPDGFLLQK